MIISKKWNKVALSFTFSYYNVAWTFNNIYFYICITCSVLVEGFFFPDFCFLIALKLYIFLCKWVKLRLGTKAMSN